ncbi:S ribonuclease [Pyrus ussuriensis x Pyrus communis]|uniref:S ribonuclease n=1 Tax=Pyrus ussuriensis x Pyrus communis TaxID=2448454 RepID=A0A5N5I862_9ROSA|nr:S ribonuclease [Pyrus ussuriensis x Pyrus communis]
MAPRSRRNTTKSGNGLDAYEAASQLNESQYIITSIHALGEAQKEIAAFMKELKNSIPKPNEKA